MTTSVTLINTQAGDTFVVPILAKPEGYREPETSENPSARLQNPFTFLRQEDIYTRLRVEPLERRTI